MADQSDVGSASGTTRHVGFWLAVAIMVVGLVAALLIQPSYLGPCSITTEFTCGYHARAWLKWLIGGGSVAVALPFLIWGRNRRPAARRPSSN